MSAYESPIPHGCPVIGDGYQGDEAIISPPDKGKGYIPRDYVEQPYDGYGSRGYYNEHDALALEDIREEIKRLDAAESQIYHRLRRRDWPIKDQGSTNYCWAFGFTSAAEIGMELAGYPYVPLSPASLAGPLVNYANRGGWGEQAAKGSVINAAPGGWVPTQYWPDTSRDRSLYRPTLEYRSTYATLDWWEFRAKDMLSLATALINGVPCAVGFNWWGHLVCAVGILWRRNALALMILNSWGQGWGDGGYGVLEGSKARPEGIVAVRSMVPR